VREEVQNCSVGVWLPLNSLRLAGKWRSGLDGRPEAPKPGCKRRISSYDHFADTVTLPACC